jgi:hypothetical protein
MTMADVEIFLNPQPDGCGYLYGDARWKGERVRIDVLPPAPLCRRDFPIPESPPDATRWVVIADGSEVGRIEATWQNLIEKLETLLLHGEGAVQ